MAEARCGCGALRLTIKGQPVGVVACHCLDCQRRSGSPFGVGAYYPAESIEVEGESRAFTRTTASGGTFTSYFCPTCGSTVYWRAGKHPTMLGVAVGAIADPDFTAPMRSVWEQSKHQWVEIPAYQHFPRGRD